MLACSVLVINARDNEQQEQWQQIINLCNETGKQCPKHLGGE